MYKILFLITFCLLSPRGGNAERSFTTHFTLENQIGPVKKQNPPLKKKKQRRQRKAKSEEIFNFFLILLTTLLCLALVGFPIAAIVWVLVQKIAIFILLGKILLFILLGAGVVAIQVIAWATIGMWGDFWMIFLISFLLVGFLLMFGLGFYWIVIGTLLTTGWIFAIAGFVGMGIIALLPYLMFTFG